MSRCAIAMLGLATVAASAWAQPLSLNLPQAIGPTRALLEGGGDADIVVIGDSLSFRSGTWIYDFRSRVASAFGDAGSGYQGFSIWTGAGAGMGWSGGLINGDPSPHRGLDGLWLSSGPGQGVPGTVSTFDGLADHAALHYVAGPASGAFTVTLSDGSSTLVDAFAPTASVRALSYLHAGPLRRISVQPTGSGEVVILGQNNTTGGPGARVHRVANGGWGVNSYLGRDWTFDAQLAMLGPELIYIWIGQNDQGKSRSEYAGLIGQLIDRVRAAAPSAGVVLVGTYDAGGGSIPVLVQGVHDAAISLGTGFINMYSAGGPRPFLLANGYLDGTHFSSSGGAYIGGLMHRAFMTGVVEPFCGATITSEPQGQTVEFGENATFTTSAIATEPIAYRWYRNGLPLSDGGRISGAATAQLTITGVTYDDSAIYLARATTACGFTSSIGASLVVPNLCPGDVNHDGFVDAIDYDQFITAWLQSAPSADFNGDEFVDAIDYDEFISHFLAGC